ncbi:MULTISPECIES: hypothetical protein [Photorhabdus]|uniref:Uncharacterized protein n=2 Tax=Photorhabdus asymbiotica TaxID=291112 RepID=C7BPN7_PHOAA|nr:hypothetical protein [Photorhabdus asymbiotica]RKS56814.1 hypothetical protein BDD30_3442 [Photorhabdus asymbiotica]CAQ84819.1 conserved hypothetical protein [Photorhabdus asymbiotica]
MVTSKILKVKKWINLNEAATRLSLSLEEHINALDLMELALDNELILSVKFPRNQYHVIREIEKKSTPYIEYLDKMFKFELFSTEKNNIGEKEYKKLQEIFYKEEYDLYISKIRKSNIEKHEMSYDFFLNQARYFYWDYVDSVKSMNDFIFELPLIGSERIDVESLIEINNKREPCAFYNIDGVFLRDSDGRLYNLMSKFNDEILSSWDDDLDINFKSLYLDDRHYYPADGLPVDCEIGMSPINLSNFERSLSDVNESVSREQIMMLLGAVLQEVTSRTKKWTQGDLALSIDEKKIKNMKERAINGIFSKANKLYKSIN